MKKHDLIFLTFAFSGRLLSGCGNTKQSESSVSESLESESTKNEPG